MPPRANNTSRGAEEGRTERLRLDVGRGSYGRDGLRSVALIGTYVPRRCGIATFTADLAAGLSLATNEVSVGVVALNDTASGYPYPREVEFEIGQNELSDYRTAADRLNTNRTDIVSVQHEFGIFGGQDGSHILKLLARLRMPVVTTLHTVLRNPSPGQRAVIEQLAEVSDRLVCMSETGRRFLREVYGVDDERVRVIPHGIPDLPFVDPNFYKDQFGVLGKKVLLTFGLLSPNKGIEHAIRALPDIARAHPDVVYIVLGATHPHVRRESGESYRLGLQRLARELGVDDRVVFHDRYVDLTELAEFLGCADIYLTPYLNEEQIVSGTLAYAMGAGKAVVSTPYWYAVEMLAEGRGRLVGFGAPHEIARAVVELLDDETGRHAMRKRAYTYMRSAVWGEVGRQYLELFAEVRRDRARRPRPSGHRSAPAAIASLPEIDLAHLRRMTDDTGILQHAKFYVPDRRHGYCTDDNARALVVASLAGQHITAGPELRELAVKYLSFLHHAFDPRLRTFRNFMTYDRRFTEERGSPDSHGRAIWALGVAAAEISDPPLRYLAQELLHDALLGLDGVRDLRPMAFSILGLGRYLDRFGGDTPAKRTRNDLATRLFRVFRAAQRQRGWPWPEDALTYANARLPHALIESGVALSHDEMVAVGLRSLQWLMDVQTIGGRFAPIGNNGWYPRGGVRARFDQQPIEADASVAACAAAYRASGDREWVERALLAFHWFLGQNDAGQELYDHRTGGCRDGLQPDGVNDNEGAESTLAWLHSLIRMHELQAEGRLGWTDHLTPVSSAKAGSEAQAADGGDA